MRSLELCFSYLHCAEITGASIDGLQNIDLDGEFQPDEFDKQMSV